MGLPWIKIEHATLDKPELFAIARHLGITREDAFFLCVRFWVWADVNSVDGSVRDLSDKDLDKIVTQTGFADALFGVGWLDLDANNMVSTIPKFTDHNGDSAKSRAVDSKNKQKRRKNKAFPENESNSRPDSVRKMSDNAPDKEGTRLDKIRLDKKEKREKPIRDVSLPILPEEFSSLQPTLEDWLQYKAERKEGYKPTGLKALIGRITNLAQERGAKTVEDKIRTAMASGWKGWDHESQSGSSSNGHADIPF